MGVDLSLMESDVHIHTGHGNGALYVLAPECKCAKDEHDEIAAYCHACPTTAAELRANLPRAEEEMRKAYVAFPDDVEKAVSKLRVFVEEAERLEAEGKQVVVSLSY